jgi:hypothetical protein
MAMSFTRVDLLSGRDLSYVPHGGASRVPRAPTAAERGDGMNPRGGGLAPQTACTQTRIPHSAA